MYDFVDFFVSSESRNFFTTVLYFNVLPKFFAS